MPAASLSVFPVWAYSAAQVYTKPVIAAIPMPRAKEYIVDSLIKFLGDVGF